MAAISIEHHRYYQASFQEKMADVSKSPLAKATIVSMIALSLFAYHRRYPLSSKQRLGVKVLAVGTIVGMAYHWKLLAFETLLVINLIKNFFFGWEWWNQIDENIYLGAIPLERFDHENTLKNELGITAVVSIIEEFERETTTLFGKAVSTDVWQRHLHLSSPDFLPPSIEELDRGADWIKTQVDAGRKVYIHCKSGAGRSPSVVLAYYIKHLKMDAEAARDNVFSRRPHIFSSHSKMMERMREYHMKIEENNHSA